jgi:hypothetical protein
MNCIPNLSFQYEASSQSFNPEHGVKPQAICTIPTVKNVDTEDETTYFQDTVV